MRTIDADALRSKARQAMLEIADTPLPNDYASKLAVKMGEMFQKLIDEAPTVDAEPMRHGRWEPEFRHTIFGEPFICRHVCSACGNGALCEQADYDAEEELSPYCPNCGANMTEVKD